jgi:DNA-directed RNA polymerase specialized sigma24 family protein
MKNTAYNVTHGTSAVQRSQAYASAQDFCAIFREDMDSLYSLALTLTGSHELAHQAFLAALNDCRDGSAVFQEWARSWSRRAVIKSAIRLLDPIRYGVNEDVKLELKSVASEMDPSAGWFLLLDRLERFVFVISVLEGYTVPECAALLGAGAREVEQARVRALEQIAHDKQNILLAPYVNSSQRAATTISTLH